MNYSKSQEILAEVKKSQKILVNSHRSPDADSVGSALAVYLVLKKMGKEVRVICPDSLPEDLKFLPHSQVIEKVDFRKFNFGDWDLFLVLDSANVAMTTGRRDLALPNIPTIVIDHHKTNEEVGKINLVDENISSTAELVYLILEDWEADLDKDICQSLLAGIIADTGVFRFPNVTGRTLVIAKALMDKGADKKKIIANIFSNFDFNKVKFWGEILTKMEKDEAGFVWSSVSYEDFKKFGSPLSAKESAATLFAPVVKGADFGMIMVEEEKGILSVSFRSRGDFDVSKIAEKLGGGGHASAAGAKIYLPDFDQAVLRVLAAAREIVDEKDS
ncbi:MAG: DHH family phosphoesterase [Patescibacteria group bacterium]